MFHQDNVKIENNLAQDMLKQAVLDPNIKRALKDISQVLIDRVLTLIRSQLRNQLINVEHFSKLPASTQELLKNLAAEHSAERRQYGAVMPEVVSSANIIDSMANVKKLLDAQEKTLLAIDKITTVDEMAVVLKIIVELGYTYYEAPRPFHTSHFENIKNLITPTTEEMDIRLFRSELGEQPVFALTYGIGTTDKDLGLQTQNQGRNAGKSAFGIVSMKKRLELLCAQYDKTQDQKYRTKMEYYKIPLNKDERKSLEFYAKKWETFFEKLIKDSQTQTSLPLIASVSRATARTIITLHDLGAFNKIDGSFDFDKAQIISNCIMGFIVHAGHHSIVEVAEVYNRLLDCVAIDSLEKNGPKPEMIEEKMPYYRIGNYHSFFHKNYVDKVIEVDQNQKLKTHFN